MQRGVILIADDEPNIISAIRGKLKQDGYDVITAANGADALRRFKDSKPDLIILDVNMPIMDGFETCKELRKTSNIPIIMLTARFEEIDKVVGLELGADDYITKPSGLPELATRVKTILRRLYLKPEAQAELKFGELLIDLERHEVRIKKRILELKPKEFELLKILTRKAGKVYTREHLLDTVWGFKDIADTRTIDVHIRKLREKIEKNPSSPKYLKTVYGVGYKFEYRED